MKTKRLQIRVSDKEWREIKRQAKANGMKLSRFVVGTFCGFTKI